MKIALLCNGYGRVNRGAEQFTQMIYDHLSSSFDIDIWSIQDTGTSFRDDIHIPWRNGRAYMESYRFGHKWYRSCDIAYDIVLNNAGWCGSYWCNRYRRKTGVPFVSFERGGGREEYLNLWMHPDCMIYLTEASRQRFHKKYKKRIKSRVIPIGIDLEPYQNIKPDIELVNDLEHPIFLSTSALVGFKRVDLSVDAVHHLGHGSLVQTSSGDMKDIITQRGREKLGDRFRYLGVIERDQLLGLYKASNVFINSSIHEAFGIVYLEAMASGLPVVTQKDSHRMEIINNAGFFVDCTDIDSYAQALDLASKTNGGNSLKQVQKFSWKKLVPEYVDMIEEVAD